MLLSISQKGFDDHDADSRSGNMLTVRLLGALLSVLPALSFAEVSVPGTPAGRTLSAWLDAFNSADRARAESFDKTYAWGTNLDDFAGWIAETGGYELLDIYANDQTTVFFRVRARANGAEEIGRITVTAAAPVAVTELGTWRIPPDAKVDVVKLDTTARTNVIDRVAAVFDSFYVYPDIGKKISAALRKRAARGEYRSMLYGIDLARKLTEDLREVSHDKHAEVRFSFVVQPADLSTKDAGPNSQRLVAMNCGFQKAEHLPPNVGYLKLDMFADTEVCAATASAAMNFLADSDALVLDLRENHGGGGGMVEYIASYLFAERTRLDDIYSRTENATEEVWTSPDVPGKRFTGKPVFLLTSKETFSAAEYLANVLRNLKRATLIGETTGGGAHTGETMRIDDHFSVRVPSGRPITKTDWEGTGVEPDVKVEAAQAVDVALKLAAEEVGKKQSTLAE
jgi:Peptidase family S41/N-terminal domain of Peptidase_S41 in eukaryotic IRBP